MKFRSQKNLEKLAWGENSFKRIVLSIIFTVMFTPSSKVSAPVIVGHLLREDWHHQRVDQLQPGSVGAPHHLFEVELRSVTVSVADSTSNAIYLAE